MELIIKIDTREKRGHIEKSFKKNNINFIKEKNDVGDYALIIPEIDYECSLYIELKANLEELSMNLCEKRDENYTNRFERELLRAKEQGKKLVILIEDADWYENMMKHNYKTKLKPKAFRGMLLTLRAKYGVEIVGVDKELCSSYIYNILYYQARAELREKGIKI